MPHPSMSSEELRQRTQGVWDKFYTFSVKLALEMFGRPCVRALPSSCVSKLYRQMYANTVRM